MPDPTVPDFAAIAAGLNQQQVQPTMPLGYDPMKTPTAPQGGWGPLSILGGAAATGLGAKFAGPRIMAAGRALPGLAARAGSALYTTPETIGAWRLMPAAAGEAAKWGIVPTSEMGAGMTAATTGGLTTAGMIAAPVAGAVAGGLAWQGLNSQDFGGEGSTLDRGLPAGVGGALAGAGLGATAGSIVPGIGTAVGAGVGAVAGGVSAALANIKWGDKDTKFKKFIADAQTNLDYTFSNLVKIHNVDPAIAEQAATDMASVIERINEQDVGTDEKMVMFDELQTRLIDKMAEYKDTATASTANDNILQAQEAEILKQNDLQAFAQGVQNTEDTKRALAVQAFIADQMRPYADQMAAGGDNAGALAAMQSAQAMPALMGMQAQSERIANFQSQRQMAIQETQAQAQLISAYAQMANAQKSALSGGSTSGNPLDNLAVGG